MKSTNNLSLSGRLTADAVTNEAKSYARFTIAHNMGRDAEGNQKAIFIELSMFAKNHNKNVAIPFDLLKKGQPVVVNAWMMPDSYTAKDGRTVNTVRYVVKSVEAITPEEADAEDEAEAPAEAEPEKATAKKTSKKATK